MRLTSVVRFFGTRFHLSDVKQARCHGFRSTCHQAARGVFFKRIVRCSFVQLLKKLSTCSDGVCLRLSSKTFLMPQNDTGRGRGWVIGVCSQRGLVFFLAWFLPACPPLLALPISFRGCMGREMSRGPRIASTQCGTGDITISKCVGCTCKVR